MSLIEQIQQIAKPIVESKGAFIVDVAIRHEGKSKMIEIFADTDRGISTGLCADISREVSGVFDGSDLFPDRYYLVVSSPGVDRPLKFQRQYGKNIGRSLTVKYRDEGQPRQSNVTLIEADEKGIVVKYENDESRRIEYDAIIEARVNAAW